MSEILEAIRAARTKANEAKLDVKLSVLSP